ncbi:MAG: glutamate-cysteine ligase family protein [Actinomycetota bacterium]
MPSQTPVLSLKSARELISERSFVSETQDKVGVELEWFTDPHLDVHALEAIVAPIEPLPYGSTITFEPGGQIELSSAPLPSAIDACDAIASDASSLEMHLATHGIALSTRLPSERTLDLRTKAPRYVAMRRFFEAYGPAAGRMMCGSTAIHVNLDAGVDDEGRARFDIATRIGPALAASFADSPLIDEIPSGWKSTRLASWLQLDPSRTQPITDVDAWVDYALDALVMFIRCGDDYRCSPAGLTFRRWITDGSPDGFPDDDDLAYHLTTLFPPVRPHGHLELRMIDMVDDPWWRVAVAVASTLVNDPATRAEIADDVVDPLSWELAARCALEDPPIARAAAACFDVALRHADARVLDEIAEYADRFVRRGRCPADEQLDAFLFTEAR